MLKTAAVTIFTAISLLGSALADSPAVGMRRLPRAIPLTSQASRRLIQNDLWR